MSGRCAPIYLLPCLYILPVWAAIVNLAQQFISDTPCRFSALKVGRPIGGQHGSLFLRIDPILWIIPRAAGSRRQGPGKNRVTGSHCGHAFTASPWACRGRCWPGTLSFARTAGRGALRNTMISRTIRGRSAVRRPIGMVRIPGGPVMLDRGRPGCISGEAGEGGSGPLGQCSCVPVLTDPQ